MLKAALIGAGGWGATHLNNWNLLAGEGRVAFAGVCDVNAANLADARALGVPCFTDAREMLESVRPDIVSVSAGIPAHKSLLALGLEYGAHVLMEKPLASTLADSDAMIAAAAGSERFALIAFQFLYTASTGRLKKLILDGRYGRLLTVSVRCAVARDDAYYARNSWAGKIHSPTGGAVFDSPLANAFAHYLNLALYCSGPTLEATAKMKEITQVKLLRARKNIDNFDSCAFTLETDTAVSVRVMMTHTPEKREWPNLVFQLEYAEIRWDASGWTLLPRNGAAERVGEDGDAQREMFRSVLEYAECGRPPHGVCTLETAREHVRCVEAVQTHPVEFAEDAVYSPENGGVYMVPDLEKRLGR